MPSKSAPSLFHSPYQINIISYGYKTLPTRKGRLVGCFLLQIRENKSDDDNGKDTLIWVRYCDILRVSKIIGRRSKDDDNRVDENDDDDDNDSSEDEGYNDVDIDIENKICKSSTDTKHLKFPKSAFKNLIGLNKSKSKNNKTNTNTSEFKWFDPIRFSKLSSTIAAKNEDELIASNGYKVHLIKSVKLSEMYLNSLIELTSLDNFVSLVDPDYNTNANANETSTNTSTNTSGNTWDTSATESVKSSNLGQFFASPENTQVIISLASINRSRMTTYIEPSCGDGRLALSLLQKLLPPSSNNIVVNCDAINWRMILIDIDSDMIQLSRANIEKFDDGVYKRLIECGLIEFEVCDYFTFRLPHNVVDGHNEDNEIVIFGGPPYSLHLYSPSNHTSNNDNVKVSMDTTLPQKFIIHSLVGLGAGRVVFILPARVVDFGVKLTGDGDGDGDDVDCGIEYRRITDADGDGYADAASGSASSEVFKVTSYNSGDKFDCDDVDAEVVVLNDDFEFWGRHVRQPTVLQMWERVGR